MKYAYYYYDDDEHYYCYYYFKNHYVMSTDSSPAKVLEQQGLLMGKDCERNITVRSVLQQCLLVNSITETEEKL